MREEGRRRATRSRSAGGDRAAHAAIISGEASCPRRARATIAALVAATCFAMLSIEAAHAGADPHTAPPRASIRHGAATFDFPAVGAVSSGNTFCSGTLIGCRSILTAAHCVCRNDAGNCAVTDQVSPQDIHVFLQHVGFVGATAVTVGIGGLDLALITLDQPVTGITPLPLNPLTRPDDRATVNIVGFGTEHFDDMVPQGVGIKRTAAVRLRPCDDLLESLVFLCAPVSADRDPSVCPGDSGGPLFVNQGAGPVLAAVADFVRGEQHAAQCVPPFTAYFTDVVPWRSAIETAGGGDVGSAPCGDLPAVGTRQVTVYPFSGELSAAADEVAGSFEVPPGTAALRVTMNGALVMDGNRNNFDLGVDREGGSGSSSCSDSRESAFGACAIPWPDAGQWRVRARRITGEGEVQLTATLFDGAGVPTPSPTPSPLPIDCTGDCDGSRSISITELLRLVNIALGSLPLSACPEGRLQGPPAIAILIQAVSAALFGCPPA